MPFDPKRYEAVQRILGDPELYPSELLSWILKKLKDNPYFSVAETQLPTADNFLLVGDAGQPAFVSPWSNFGSGWAPLSFRKDPFGTVFVQGVVKTGSSVSAGATITTLPTGYRPEFHHLFAQEGSPGSGQHCRVDVESDGEIVYRGATGTVAHLGVEMTFKAFS